MRKPKAPKKTAEQLAGEIRTRSLLDEEIEEEEERFRMLSRGKLGRASLIGRAPRSRKEAASGASQAAAPSTGGINAASQTAGLNIGFGR